MSVVAAVARSGRVWMASDTALFSGDEQTTDAVRKVRRARGVVFGVVGDLAPVSLLLRAQWLPRHCTAGELHDALRGALRHCPGDVAVLVGVGGVIWYLDRRGMHRWGSGYAAIGTGAPWATGALSALWRRGNRLDPRRTLRRAIQAAERHCTMVDGWSGTVSA